MVSQPQVEAPVQLEVGEQEFEVERILGVRHIQGGRQFLIKWKGYGAWGYSWEPNKNLGNAKELV